MRKPKRTVYWVKNKQSWYDDFYAGPDNTDRAINSWWKIVKGLAAPRCSVSEMTDYGHVNVFPSRIGGKQG